LLPFAVPALAVASHEQAGQEHASQQQSHAALATSEEPASFSQHALALASATLVALAALTGQQAAPPQHSQPSALMPPLAVASQVQALQAQASPQQAHAALAAFDLSAAVAPTPITAARAKAPTMLSIPRRSMIRLPTR
jgi:hypothetical protein